jgi:hypothetical protein
MKRKFIIILVVLISSCSSRKALYSWENYDATSYNYIKNRDDKAYNKLVETYTKIIERQRGTRACVPPGLYADYGFILIQTNKEEEGKEMLKKEINLYPESKIFVDKILQMIENE